MNKARVEAFTDAVVAIIMTIMVLELKAPTVPNLEAMGEELPYIIAYIISFAFICTHWYNQHYIMTNAVWISKRAFWANNWWLLTMSMVPLSTAWVSEFPFKSVPEYFYFFTYVLWASAFYLLRHILFLDNRNDENYRLTHQESQRTRLTHMRWDILTLVLGIIGIHFLPILGLSLTVLAIFTWIIWTPKNSDHIE